MERSKKVLRIAKGELQDNAAWFMRQAGRYLPAYQEIRKGRTFLDLLKEPALIHDVSLLPLKYYEPDAIVIFTDILLPYSRLGYSVSYENGISVTPDPDSFDYYSSLSEGMRKVSAGHRDKTVIGVLGGPFTTFSYLNDGGKDGFHRSKEILASGDTSIISRLTEEIIEFARVQARSGADVIQIFESWIGSVSENFYLNHLEENELYFVEKIKELGKPVIFFSEGSFHLTERLKKLDPDVYSLDWKTGIDRFYNILPGSVIQGNLDPYLLGTDDRYLKGETRKIMEQGKEYGGHIFNLGHGVPPWADWKKLALIVDEVHSYDR